MTDPEVPPELPRRRRRVRLVLAGLAAVAALVALAPFFLGPVLRGMVVERIEAELEARARVHAVSFRWPARLRVEGLELVDLEGAPLASLDQLRVTLSLGALLTGRIEGEAELVYPELHLARAPGGRLNWEKALAKLPSGEAKDAGKPGSEPSLPQVRAQLRITDGNVVLHGPEGETTLADVALEANVDGLDRPAPFRLALAARGPLGPAGRVGLAGSVTAAPAGRLDVADASGEAKLTLEELDLAAFAPALALFAPVDGLAGKLRGNVELALAPGLALSGTSDVELADLVLQGPLASAPLRIARVELRGNAAHASDGAGTQRLELRAEPILALVYDGTSRLTGRGTGDVAGTLTLTADLAQVTEAARGWVKLREGVRVAGRAEHVLELTAKLADARPEAMTIRARGGVTGLAASDAAGRALDLTEWAGIELELDAAADLAAGTLSVPALNVRAGPVTCAGRLEATGLAAGAGAFAVRSGALRVEADLERLQGALAQLVDVEGRALGGQLDADVTLGGEGGGLDLAAKLDGRELFFAGTSLAELRGDLGARRAADGTLAGSGALRLGALSVARASGEPLVLPGSSLDLALQEDAAGKGEHSLDLETDDGSLVLALRAESTRTAPGALALQTTFRLDGRVAGLAGLAAAFAPVLPGLAGDLRAEGELRAATEGGELASAGARIGVVLSELQAKDAAGNALALEALARTELALTLALDAQSGVGTLESLTLAAEGLQLSATARVTGLEPGAAGAPAPALETGRIELTADLARLGPELARVVDLAGWSLSGAPLAVQATVGARAGRVEASGHLGTDTLRLERPEGAPIALADVALDFDLGYDSATGSLELRRAAAGAGTATLQLSGTLADLLVPERARGELELEFAGALERILADMGLEGPESGRKTAGQLGGKFTLAGDRGAFRVTGRSAIEGFRLELAGRDGEPPLVIEEPTIALECDGRVELAALDVELTKLTLASGLARGGAQGRIENLKAYGTGDIRLAGWTGHLAYVPDRLGVVLAPLLPGKLSGAEEERVTFSLDCSVRELDLASLLARAEARVDLGLGHFERPEVQLDGALVLETKPDRVKLSGDLLANGGTLQLDTLLDLAQGSEQPRSELDVSAKELRANAGLAPLLALIHPAFATIKLTQGTLDGLIGLDLDVSYDGPLSPELLAAGWDALPKEPINGAGRLELRSASLRGSPLLAMLAEFGVDVSKTLDVRPIEFTIREGRVTYAKPWTWSFSGTETTFTGSIGLDETLDLAWNVPISDKLVERWSFLAALKDTSLAIPIRGTVRAPKLEAGDLLADLAARVAKRELEDRLGLGGGSGEDPAAILSRADALWGEGKKAEAALLYTRLREDYKLSLPYALNKDRIKDRSKYRDPPK